MREHLKFQLEVSFLNLDEEKNSKLYSTFSGASSVLLQGWDLGTPIRVLLASIIWFIGCPLW